MKVVFGSVLICALAAVAVSYSITGTLENHTTYTFLLQNSNCTKGAWTLLPAQQIPPGYSATWTTDGGTLGATAGNFVYAVAPGGPQFYFAWNVPTVGFNTFNSVAIPPNVVTYKGGKNSAGSTVSVVVSQDFGLLDAPLDVTVVEE